EPINHRYAGFQIQLGDALRRVLVEHHDKCAERITVSRHKNVLAAHDAWKDFRDVVGKRARKRILQTLAAGRRYTVRATPDVHLLLAPFFPGVVLIESHEIAVVAFVESLVPENRN